jgi:aminoacyl tRNA synthase complex-interacting multifunctional protein 1
MKKQIKPKVIINNNNLVVAKKPKEAKPQPGKKVTDDGHPASRLDLRVGRIVEIGPHADPEATKLYCEQIDIGNGEIRGIASGLRGRIPLEILKGTNVIVLCNLKARSLKGFMSHGMV